MPLKTKRLAYWMPALLLVLASAPSLLAGDHLYELQTRAKTEGHSDVAHWGPNSAKYISWSSHSNRLIPIYTFGATLDDYQGENSAYRDAAKLEKIYGRMPTHTLNPKAEYFDQTDTYRLQKRAAKAGKKYIFLVVFDGLDWHGTRAAAIYYNRADRYGSGRGTGLYFQDYRGAPTDFGYFVNAPHNSGTKTDVNGQVVLNPGGKRAGGYDPRFGGATPWAAKFDPDYLIGKNRRRPHPYIDSAAGAVALTAGVKTYNGSINVGPQGEQLTPIARELQKQGYAVGVVTSVPISHATPAAAYANNVSRNDYQDISRDLVGQPSIAHRGAALPGVDVLLGAGWGVKTKSDSKQGRNFVPGPKYYTEQMLEKADLRHGGKYQVVTRQAGVRGAPALAAAASQAAERGTRLLGVFGTDEGHLPFATANGDYGSYSKAELNENPTLAELASAALRVLERKDRFWMMLEAGDVDWAEHGNNLDNMIGAIKSGDDAFRAVVEWIERRDAWKDSLVIVTADHGHLLILDQPKRLIPPAK